MLRILASTVVCTLATLPAECDDLSWADQSTHVSGGNGTQQDAFSWHVHYLHQTQEQEAEVLAFQNAFCVEFGKYGASGSSLGDCDWGPNYLGNGEDHMCGGCSSLEQSLTSERSCGSGTCTDPVHGPWSVCQNEFFVPARYIDEVTVFLSKYEDSTIGVMRHPNTGCQWGDHFIRAEFFGAIQPEMCLWGLPCNEPGFGCKQGMCGKTDGTHDHQHASGCYQEADESTMV